MLLRLLLSRALPNWAITCIAATMLWDSLVVCVQAVKAGLPRLQLVCLTARPSYVAAYVCDRLFVSFSFRSKGEAVLLGIFFREAHGGCGGRREACVTGFSFPF